MIDIKSSLGWILNSKKTQNYILETALSKIENLEITPREAVAIIRDAEQATAERLPNITIDEAVEITSEVIEKASWARRALYIAGVVIATISAWFGGSEVSTPTQYERSQTTVNAPIEIVPNSIIIEVSAYVSAVVCENDCQVISVVPTRTGYMAIYNELGENKVYIYNNRK